MSRNRFEKLVNTSLKASEDQKLQDDKTRRARLPVSTDYFGSPLKRLFDDDGVKIASEFLDLMRKYDFPGSERLSLKRKRLKTALSKYEMLSSPYSKVKKSARLISWATLWKGRGYLVGSIYRMSNTPSEVDCCRVYLCSDGKLRCMRAQPVFDSKQSFAVGYGTIPSASALNSSLVFSTGKFKITDPAPYRAFNVIELETLLRDYVNENIVKV